MTVERDYALPMTDDQFFAAMREFSDDEIFPSEPERLPVRQKINLVELSENPNHVWTDQELYELGFDDSDVMLRLPVDVVIESYVVTTQSGVFVDPMSDPSILFSERPPFAAIVAAWQNGELDDSVGIFDRLYDLYVQRWKAKYGRRMKVNWRKEGF